MSDLTGKTITIPADLSTLSRTGGAISPAQLRRNADYNDENAGCELPSSRFLRNLADEIERQCLARMDEPDEFGAMVEAATAETGRERWLCGEPATANGELGGKRWWRNEHADIAYWSDLIDPRPVGGAS